MAQAAIAAQIHQALDVHRGFAAKIAFHGEISIDDFANTHYFGIVQLIDPAGRLNACLFNDLGGVGTGSQAEAGFQAAAARWEALFNDPVTVRLDVGFSSFGAGMSSVLGSADSQTVGRSYGDVKTALSLDITSTDDTTAVANLPTGGPSTVYGGPALSFWSNTPAGGTAFDADGGANNSILDVNRANAKALGLLTDDGLKDGEISFNSDFGFDFDPSDGITAGLIDFVGVATHEIGHALGFVSGVDIVDLTSGTGPFAATDLSNFRVFSVLDLYRYKDDTGAGVLNFTTNGDPYFSIDGGTTRLADLANGRFNGSHHRQASHWEDNLGLGILDPTAGSGEQLAISSLDIQALDVIGWDRFVSVVVPTPAAGWMGLALLGTLGLANKIRRDRWAQ